MQRVTISLDAALARALDRHVKARNYQSRSEAMRDMVRDALVEDRTDGPPDAPCVANLSYVYNHHVRSLAKRLMAMQHEQHDLVAATTRVHLDHDHCIETLILKGGMAAVQRFADTVSAERGVRFARLNVIAVERNDRHFHKLAHTHHGHAHLSPLLG